jgi:hypothetical protein
MLNRACRILGSTPESPAIVSPPTVAATARLSSHERLSRWKSLMLKIQQMFYCLWIQTKTALLLGQPVYNQLFNARQYQIATPPSTKLRFIRGEVVGKQLPRGQGKEDASTAHVNPGLCHHPEDTMKPRGNLGNKWWTCKKCLCRWERLSHSEITPTTGTVDHLDLMTFGKHTGETYQEIAMHDPSYCIWARRTVEEEPTASQGLQRFVQYLTELALSQTYEADDFHELVENSLFAGDFQAVPESADMDL